VFMGESGESAVPAAAVADGEGCVKGDERFDELSSA